MASEGGDLVVGADGLARCGWVPTVAEYQRYHDDEWGKPVHGDDPLFERISLEAFQSGLSWAIILRKRPAFRTAFAGFQAAEVAEFGPDDVERLLGDEGIVRNRAKIAATIANAQVVTALVEAEGPGALDALVWAHAPPPAEPGPTTLADVRATSPESEALAKTLKRRGIRFVGPTTAYALMQACGLVDDHLEGCHRRGVWQS